MLRPDPALKLSLEFFICFFLFFMSKKLCIAFDVSRIILKGLERCRHYASFEKKFRSRYKCYPS